MILGGIVVLLAVGGDLGAYGLASAVGAGLSVLLLNLLYRMSVSGDRGREREEEARRYFDEHGVWPEDDEPTKRASSRRWTLPDGVVTAEQEERERDSRVCAERRPLSWKANEAPSGDPAETEGIARFVAACPADGEYSEPRARARSEAALSGWCEHEERSGRRRVRAQAPLSECSGGDLLIALASLVVPGIVAIIAAAVSAF